MVPGTQKVLNMCLLTDDLPVLPVQGIPVHLHLHPGHDREAPSGLWLGKMVTFPKYTSYLALAPGSQLPCIEDYKDSAALGPAGRMGTQGRRLRHKLLG